MSALGKNNGGNYLLLKRLRQELIRYSNGEDTHRDAFDKLYYKNILRVL